ncbi:LysR family transcriptional regulator [Frigidibacter sp. MR17.24]|uniref:LysR family transcriptional regulator n=1 Tax=Frigidibacter sp. MR17.24 TaxID=3127345 RepID=UPI003012BE8E
MITHRQIEAFREVMRNGSVTAAAEYLGLSQPAVSRLIRDLEASIAFPLFTRHGSRVVPTPAAEEYWEVVERSFIGLDVLDQTAQRIRAGGHSGLSIATAPVFASTLLADAIAGLARRGQLQDMGAVHITTLPVVRQVARRQAQLGLNMASHHQHEVDLVVTHAVGFHLIATPDHPLAARDEVIPEDLAGQPYVGFDEGTVTGQIQGRWFATLGTGPVFLLRSYLSTVISAFVLRGFGVSVVDPWTAAQHRLAGGISRPMRVREEMHIALIKPLGARLSPVAEHFVEEIGRQVRSVTET